MPGLRGALKAAGNRRLLSLTLLSLSSGLPLGLVSSAVPVWLRTEKISLETIGVFSLIGLPWGLKFLWAPFIDRFAPLPPDRRRGWVLAMQVALALGCLGLSLFNPADELYLVAAAAMLIAFFSATQDIALDAYAVELMKPEEYGTGNGLRVSAYRIAMLLSGGASIAAAQFLPFPFIFRLLALAFLAFTLITWLAPPAERAPTKRLSLKESIIGPFVSFVATPHAAAIIFFILLFKLGDNFAATMLQPFLVDQGYPLAEIGLAQKTVGLIATLVGATIGGVLTSAIGIRRGLILGGILQTVAHLGYWAMASMGIFRPLMYGAVSMENFFGGIGTAAFLAFLTQLCDKRYTATQYALLSSLFGLSRTLSGVPSGFLAAALGYPFFFLSTILAATPGVWLAFRVSPAVEKDSQTP